jgi:2-(1,2-epoxy-1,2-dihydrophenyl)acetyl-CoA isomerase
VTLASSQDPAERVLVDVIDGCATVTLNRPERLNALDIATYELLEGLADELANRDDVGVVVLTGAGRAFCAGADLVSFAAEIDFNDPRMVRERLDYVGLVVRKWVALDRPTIAAVNGLAFGGGANLALCCDLMLMREDATIGQTYVQRGLVLDMGGSYFLPRLVGRARAAELAFFGDAISAAEAERIGLANRCVPVAEWQRTVDEWARRLAAGAGLSQRAIKRQLLSSPSLSLEQVLDAEAVAMAAIFETEDLREAFDAFREKRAPVFRGR